MSLSDNQIYAEIIYDDVMANRYIVVPPLVYDDVRYDAVASQSQHRRQVEIRAWEKFLVSLQVSLGEDASCDQLETLAAVGEMAEEKPTVRAKMPMSVAGDVDALRKAMKGVGTDEATIINILTSCTNDQRKVLQQAYNRAYEKDLTKDLKKELSGDFEDVIVALMTPEADYLAQELHDACKHKNGRVMVEILFTADNFLIKSIKSAYERLFSTSLEESLTKATSETFQALMQRVVEAKRSDTVNEDFGRVIANELYNDVDCLENRYVFFAESLHKAMAGQGTKDQDLIRLVVSRCEVDLGNIKTEYHNLYDKLLENDIKADTSGDYRKVLLALVGE
ncbi:annexin B9 isoform X2 [Procambarus clarkii]|uniref:annexin B9 isoform X2 n=1 Tax=Procambarus clarkii TaxID=6728 RepID=UPI0037442A16